MAEELSSIEISIEERLEEINNWLRNEGYERYKEARRLSEEDAREDPETEPFKSKYIARNILSELKAKVAAFQDDDISSEKLKILMSALDYQIGQNYIETEELSTGEEHIERCIKTLEEYRLDRRCCSLYLHALNELGILWSKRGDSEKALGFLQDAERLYHSFNEDKGGAPFEVHELFYPEDNFKSDLEREKEFSATFTHTLYYLAQVNAARGNSEKGAMYCHTTLLRQLETEQYDPVDWALNCATLSQYYITQGNYMLSRHCLACASHVFAGAEESSPQEVVSEDDSQEERERKERIPQRKADISRCWSKYCLDLLKSSRDKCLEEMRSNDEDHEEPNAQRDTCQEQGARSREEIEEGDRKEPLRFDTLEVTSLEQSVPEHVVKTYDEARKLFLEGQKWLNISKEFYVLDGHVTNYVEILQDMSQLYKLLAFFDADFERRCKMHKRRIDMLSEVLVELNPQHYLLVCRQLMYEIAEAYSEMVDLKIAIVEESGEAPRAHSVKKINTLINQSIKFFQNYLDSLKRHGKLPETFDEDSVRPALVAQFYIARLYSKLICADKRGKVENLKKSLDIYQYLVKYCDSHTDLPEGAFKDELDVSREMAQLLPLKMDKVMMSEP